MIYVAVVPGFVWAAVLLALAAAIAFVARRRLGAQQLAMKFLLLVVALQTLAGVSVAMATILDPIGMYACLVGIYGTLGSVFLAVIEAGVIFFLATIWPRSGAGKRLGLASWVLLWLLFQLAAFLTHARSAVLCTV